MSLGYAGESEAISVPWPILLRNRLTEKAHGSDRFRWWVLWTVLAGLFSVNVTFTIFAVALPRIARDFGTSTNTLTWVITGPLLAFGIVAPVLGKVGDLKGHRRLYLLGLAGASIFAALSAIAWSATALIVIRTLSAVEGAATGASSMALIFSEFDRDDRVKAMGWWSLVGAGGPVIGVAIGGPLIEAVGWRWIFVGQIPLTIAALGLAFAVLRETPRGDQHRLDWAGAVTLAFGITSFLFALNRGPEWGWSHPLVIGAFVFAPVALAAFVVAERRADEPLLPLDIIRRRNFSLPIGAQMFSNFAYMGGFILAPTLLARMFGYGESKIGFFVLARPLTFSIAAPVAGYLAVKIGERTAAVAGTLTVVGSMLAFATITPSAGDVFIIGALALSGVGLGMASPSISSSVANSVDEESLGIASAAQQLVTQVGVVAGIQLMSTIQASREASDGLAGSFRAAYLVGAGVCGLGVICAMFLRSAQRGAPEGAPMSV
ncbi:MAG TPA: MFS transporter [Acidimicrobiales bacterium]|nr:MFS transporter [Acidimicrobiales bacterium]